MSNVSALADQLRNSPNAFAGAMGDLARGMKLTPEDLATLILPTAGKSPDAARRVVGDMLAKGLPSGSPEPAKPGQLSRLTSTRQRKPPSIPKENTIRRQQRAIIPNENNESRPASEPRWSGGSRA
jgi:hypothetical protein